MAISQLLRYQVWQRDGGLCGLCGLPVPFDRTMHADHIQQRSVGGADTIDNLRATHQRCNLERQRERRAQEMDPTGVTGLRIKPSLREQIDRIVARERRNRNNWIVLTLEDAVERYLAEHPELRLADQERSPQ